MKQPIRVKPTIRLRDFDPGHHDDLDKESTRKKTQQLCERIAELQQKLYANAKHSLILLLQGMDTSGKDGAARRVLEYVSPSGTETASFKRPSSEELAHDFLWRIHRAVPRYGNIGIFNRSHYEDVLVVRVMNLQPEKVWKARYAQINAFEQMLVQNNVVLLKFFLHISRKEQAERLQARLDDPKKHWKFEIGDLEMRKRWDDFQKAYEDALNRCSTPAAPWHIVPADHKWFRDYVVAKTVVDTLEKLKMNWPRSTENLSKIKIQ
jgi:PPK2 family polyphosphate:nucleotide phosphotransferase